MGLLKLLGNCVSKRAMEISLGICMSVAIPSIWSFGCMNVYTSYYCTTLVVENPFRLVLFVPAGNDFLH